MIQKPGSVRFLNLYKFQIITTIFEVVETLEGRVVQLKIFKKTSWSISSDVMILPVEKSRTACRSVRSVLKRYFGDRFEKRISLKLLKGSKVLEFTPDKGPQQVLIIPFDREIEDWEVPGLYAQAVQEALKQETKTLTIAVPPDRDEAVWISGGVRGAVLASSFPSGMKSEKDEGLREIRLGISKKDLEAHAEEAFRIAQGTAFARELVHEPPNILDNDRFVRVAQELAWDAKLDVKVFRQAELEKMGANLILAVNSGGAKEPALVHLSYKPEGAKLKVTLVGKGITYDAGGIHLKPRGYLEDMKGDMAGAAAVLGAIKVAAQLRLPVEVHAIAAIADNMVDSKSMKPGSVYKALNNKTVEVYDTDAEGRLVLADALVYAEQLNPDVIVDLATLTGSCVVALGEDVAGLFTPDDRLARLFERAGIKSGERVWRLPLEKTIRKKLQSPVADLRNIGGRWGGAIQGALFLKEFVDTKRWVHLDIAGPGLKEEQSPLSPKGGTGFGVALIIYFLKELLKNR